MTSCSLTATPAPSRIISLILSTLLLSAGTAWAGTEPGLPTSYGNFVRITDYGASVSNTGAQNTLAIIRAMDAARSSGKWVYVPPGTFTYQRDCYDGPTLRRFELNGVKIVGDGGDRSVLRAAATSNCAISITGTGAGLFNLKIENPYRKQGTTRTHVPWDASVWVWQAQDFYAANLTIDGGENGIICTYNGTGYPQRGRITANRIFSTAADAIHLTGGTRQVYVAGNFVYGPGDDCIAVVSYNGETRSADILIENNWVGWGPWARGITVIGGDHVTIRGNRIQQTAAAGILVANEESSYSTLQVDNVLVDSNLIDRCPSGTRPELSSHGSISIWAWSASHNVQNVKVINNWTYGPYLAAGPMSFQTANTANIYINGNTDLTEGRTFPSGNGSGSGVIGAWVTSAQGAGSAVTVPGPIYPSTTCNVWGGPSYIELEPQCAVGKRLDAPGSGGNGTALRLFNDQNGSNQRYRFEPVGSGYYEIIPQHATGTRVEVINAGNFDGARVQLKNDSNNSGAYNPAQRWRFEEQNRNSGQFEIAPDCGPSRRLDVPGSNPNATYIQIWTDNNSPAQRWFMR